MSSLEDTLVARAEANRFSTAPNPTVTKGQKAFWYGENSP